MNMTTEQIEQMSYPDFLGFINQTNVPPGAYDTVNRWICHGGISDKSRVMEVACTTGFSLSNIVMKTQCKGYGFDLSKKSIVRAKENAKQEGLEDYIEWHAADGMLHNPPGTFTHVILGAALGFFPNPKAMLGRVLIRV